MGLEKTQNKIKGSYVYGALGVLVFVSVTLLSTSSNVANKDVPPTPSSQPQVLGEATPSPKPAPRPTHKPIPNLKSELELSHISAEHYLVYDLDSGNTLAEKDADTPAGIASLTKLMTALVTYENSDLNDDITIPPISSAVVSPVLSLRTGDQAKILDLFNAMLVGSANDAAYVLGTMIPGTDGNSFIQTMNDRAAALGMTHTNYSNPLGYDSDFNYSSARDLKILVQHLNSYTAFQVLGKKTSYAFVDEQGVSYHIQATNKLILTHPDVYAVKTGYTDSAKGAMITKIVRDGHTIVCILIGSQDREDDTLALADEIFAKYKWE